ncbi:translocator protein [Lycorma delicatula]|uniref:translocator protein n=1 Tax=Lycorma delicatula TaxID=130591 RepID=UPI003F5173DE
MSIINWSAVGVSLLPNVGGWVGGLAMRESVHTWYETLNRPNWRPPNAAFGPVWTVLYSSMGYASYIVWKEGGGFKGPAQLPLTLYGSQLALNWLWTPIFFGTKSIKGGLIDIILLDIAAVGTALSFYNVHKKAGYLLVPYIAWLGLATALNYVIYRDNPKVEKTEKPKEPIK